MVAIGIGTVAAQSAPAPAPSSAPTPAAPAPQAPAVEIYDARIVASYPHDPKAFTQGLLWHEGTLYESTGREGQSDVRQTDLQTGKVIRRQPIPADQFGEGLALLRGTLFSLTWKDGAIHRWRLKDLAPLKSHTGYPYEGWGLTTLGDALVASDGSSNLRVLDPKTLAVRRTIPVTYSGKPLTMLNELETVDGLIFANVWMTGFVVGIDPATGAVRRVIDLRDLPKPTSAERDAVLNGIAWDAKARRLFVTGKLWDRLYEIELIKRQEPEPVR
ncbi:glutaminyl-peptide cyclotransferase [Qipengyuania sp.]|uniref:glutaminyl-peptide cyclotransferase n=1 Tax=Qipengyuania sp. TaxID=2004515 RepID=UPI0035C7D56C